MKIIDKIIGFFRKKPQPLQLDEAKEEKLDNFNESIDVQMGEYEDEIIYKLDEVMNRQEFIALIDKYIEKFCLSQNKLKFFTEKEKFDIIKEILKKKVPENLLEEKMLLLESCYKESYFSKIIMENNPSEGVRLYNEYVREFLKSNPELESEFRQEFWEDKDILRRIDLMKELGGRDKFSFMEEVPLFYDTTKESVDKEANAELAKRKKYKDITAEDLLFIRTTQVFPHDGVVEPIGLYSDVEKIGNPFMEALKRVEPNLEENDFQVMSPRYRWTSHWCINGIVGNHTQGTFTGRDFFIIEDATEHMDNTNLLNMLVTDVIHLGDMKLSPNARIMMDIEKYKELMKNPQMEKQLRNMNIILYKGNPSEALKIYMNDRGYVFGEISSFYYAKGMGQKTEDEYLAKIEKSLKEGRVPGFGHCAYCSDEGLTLSEMRAPQLVREKFIQTIQTTYKMLGATGEVQDLEDKSICAMSASVDDSLTYKTFDNYLEYLGGLFPEMQVLTEEFINAREGEEYESAKFFQLAESIIRKVGLDKIKVATGKFNDMVKEEQKRERAKKDKELFDKGLITPEEYNGRTTEGAEQINR